MAERDMRREPAAEMIGEMQRSNESVWRRRRERDAEVNEILDNDHTVVAPDTMNKLRKFKVDPEVMKSGMLGWVWLRSRSFYPVPAQLAVVSRSGPVAESRAEEVNDFLNEWLDQAQEDSGEDTWQLVVGDGLSVARGVDMVMSAEHYWWDFPTDLPDDIEERNEALKDWLGNAPVPVVWRHIPAEGAFPPSLGRINDEVLVEQEVLPPDMEEHFGNTRAWQEFKQGRHGLRLPLVSRNDSDSPRGLKLLMYANRVWLAWALADPDGKQAPTILQTYSHNMGMCPIRITPTFTTPRKRPDRYWTCPVMECVDIVKTLDKRLSEWATHSRLAGMAPWKFYVMDKGGGRASIEEHIQGDAWVFRMDEASGRHEDAMAAAPPEQSAMIGQLVQLAISLIERRTGITPVLAGQGIEQQLAAAAIKISADLASEIYEPASVNFTRHSKSIGERCLAAVAQFGETAVLARQGERPGEGRTLQLTPESAAAWTVQVEAKLQPRFQMTRTSDMGLYLQGEQQAQASGKRPWPKSWAIRNLLRVEDVRAFKREELTDEWEDRPEIAELYTQDALRAAQVVLREKRTLTDQELLDMQADGLFQAAPALERALQRRGRLPVRDNQFVPDEATMPSIRQTGRVPATVQEAEAPEGTSV